MELDTNPLAKYVGHRISDLGWRKHYGINIVYIKRGDYIIQLPEASVRILPYDKVGIVATDEQIQLFKPEFDKTDLSFCHTIDNENIVLRNIRFNNNCKLVGKSIFNSQLREKARSQIIGIERGNDRIINPDASLVFEEGDEVWIVGDEKKMKEFFEVEMPKE